MDALRLAPAMQTSSLTSVPDRSFIDVIGTDDIDHWRSLSTGNPTVNYPCRQDSDLRHTIAGARTTAMAAASSMSAAPVSSRQVSGSPNTIAPRRSATTGETNA